MKRNVNSFGFRLWRGFLLFAVILFAVLWLLQTVLLQTCYTGMAVSGLKETLSDVAAKKDSEEFLTLLTETAQDNSLLIFLTDQSGTVHFSVDAYSNLYASTARSGDSHGGGNPFLSGEDTLNWEKGVVRNLPYSHTELIRQLCLSEEESLGYLTEDESAYVYGRKLGSCAALSADGLLLCVSMPLSSVAGTAKILRVQLLWVSLLSLCLALVLAWLLSRKFEKPIQSISRQARDLARGDFHTTAGKGFCTELDDLSDTLNETAVSLNRLERSRQDLLANISHDLRTPLTMIKGYAEMVREISWSDEKARNQDLDVITREADRLTALVNEILEYSSMQSLERKPPMEVFDLSSAVEGVIRQFDALCREQSLTIDQSVDPGILVNGNRAQLERVVYNFIDNALNHSGGTPTIAVSLHSREGAALFEVTDHGPGIPPEELPYIWDRYYTSRSRRNPAAVSGLGLSIAKEILTLHEARFGVRSTGGCTFWFSLNQS